MNSEMTEECSILSKTHSIQGEGAGSSLFSRTWILSDGKIGDLVQCRGIAQALGVRAKERVVSPQKPWLWLMPYGPLAPKDHFTRNNSPIHPPFPDLLIASGWRTLAYIREVKKQCGSKVYTVFLKNPRARAPYLDLIWAPAHDQLEGDRVMTSIASPHRFAPEILETDFREKPDDLATLKTPLVGVLIGGDSKDYRFSDRDCEILASSLRSLARIGAGLAITTSRRTPKALTTALRHALDGMDIYWWDGKEQNPYGHILAHADYFVVTADSANMVGEACVRGKPVYYFRPTGGSKKFDRLLQGFIEHGAIRPLPDQFDDLASWTYEPLYAARDIASEIIVRADLQFQEANSQK